MAQEQSPSEVQGKQQALVQAAKDIAVAAKGKPYTWGGQSTAGFDCSGFVSYAYKQVFPSYTHLSAAAIRSSSLFMVVTTPAPGDVIFFPKGEVPYQVKARKDHSVVPDHVGIVLDQNTWMSSQSTTGVAPVAMNNMWWGSRPHVYLRYKAVAAGGTQ